MTSVVIISPDDAGVGTPTGLCARAFAMAYAQRGHRVRVLCGYGQIPRPGCFVDGAVTVHRLAVRRGSPDAAFSVEAVRMVHDLIRLGRCDVIECVGGGATVAGLAARRSLTGCAVPIVSLEIEPDARCAQAGADAVIPMHGGAQTPSMFPVMDGVWAPPACAGPVFALCDAVDPAAQAPIIDAYRASGVGEEGWSLALLAPDGKWTVLAGNAINQGDDVCVTVTAGQGPPLAAVHGLQRGCACLVGEASPGAMIAKGQGDGFVFGVGRSLERSMRMIAEMPIPGLVSCARAGFKIAEEVCDPDHVVSAHERAWASGAARWDRAMAIGAWRTLEHGLVS